ncbi:DUF2188 domain-containing protein [Spirosoma foliorum]|uniref:DUF2188 domain-containing protein n=1 Tax=Spirosoma foliorum TaxID=2710596 RepID=A0A7G5H2S8_9BACT|nr:DUF2188 domain-containing protein [Spirosoma foliorum]QMW05420.1 DUF2188 domain-containing protein [Spirosoma foliorum]
MAKSNVHIVPRGDQWAVKRANGQRATRLVDTQQDAIDVGRNIARHQQVELIIHNQDGQINRRDSYGHDPYPPRG